MKYLIIALSLAFIFTGKAFALTPEEEAYFSLKGKALTPEQEDYFSKMETGKCWGICAYRSSMAECISCSLSYHGIQHKPSVVYYCRKLQPKCGH